MVAPMFRDMATHYPTVQFLKVDVDELPTTSQRNGVRAMPTFDIFFAGHKIYTIVGAKMAALNHFAAAFHDAKSVPLTADIERVEQSCPGGSIPFGVLIRHFATMPIGFAIDVVSMSHFLILLWLAMNYLSIGSFSLRLLILYFEMKVIAMSPLKRFTLPLADWLHWGK